MYRKVFSKILVLLAIVSLSINPAIAEGFEEEMAPKSYYLGDSTPVVLSATALEELAIAELTYDRMFHRAMAKIISGDEGGASVILAEIREKAFREEYLNLSDFSISLLERAKQEATNNNHIEARYLATWAETLSPEDSRIQLIIASLYESIGTGKAISALSKSVSFMFMSPMFVSKIFVNSFLLLLIALTLSMFIVCLIQLTRNTELLMVNISKKFPDNYRGLIAPPLLLLLFLLPFYFGLVAALGCWSLLLCRFVKSCRWLGAIAGVLIIAWAVSLPTVERVAWQVSTPLNQAIENVNNRTYSPADEANIISALKIQSDNPILLFTYAQILRRAGKLDRAAATYQLISENTAESASVHKKSLLNLAGIYYLQRKLERAEGVLEGLEKLNEKSFEFYYNYAHVKLALLNTEEHRKFYKLASDLNEERIVWLQKYKVAQRKQVFTELPRTSFYPTFLKPSAVKVSNGEEVGSAAPVLRNVVYGSLLRNGTFFSVVLVGLLTLAIGLLIRFSKKQIYRMITDAKPFFGVSQSKIWHGMPAGGYIAGQYSIVGIFILAALIGMVICTTGKPANMMALTPVDLGTGKVMMTLTIIVFLLVSASSLIFIKDSEEESC